MKENKIFDVIIVGGSNAGLAAAMALGRALRNVLVIDSGLPCNRQTPYSHNFLTHDGTPPSEIAALARTQTLQYKTVSLMQGIVTEGLQTVDGFELLTENGERFNAKKVIFATGIKDIMPNIPGISECWGISVLHCPFCHGYEVRNLPTGIIGNGDSAYEFATLISNWTTDLTVFTNGQSTLTTAQASKLSQHNIKIREDEIQSLEHQNGHLQNIIFKFGHKIPIDAVYTRLNFEQHCTVPMTLGCELTENGYIKIDPSQKTSIKGVFACGDNATRIRTVANAIAMGTTTGIMVNRELTEELFLI